MSIRLRLALMEAGLIMLVLSAFALLVYAAIAGQERGQAASDLVLRGNELARAVREHGSADDHGRGPGRGDDGDPQALIDAAGRVLSADGTIAILAGPGRGLTVLPAGAVGPQQAAQLVRGEPSVAPRQREVDSEDWLVYEVQGGGGRERGPGGAWLASPLAQVEATLARWRLLLAGGVLGAGALALAIGWFVAGRAMRPVAAITDAARAIGASADFSGRVPEPPSQDEIGRLARTFNGMLGQLEEANASQRRFLADAAHELRTPLTVVGANLDALRTGLPDPAARREAMDVASREASRMGRLVADLLALARSDAGQRPVRRQVALDDVAMQSYQAARPLAGGVRLRIGDWDQAEVTGDPDLLRQALGNLVDNAVRHTPEGGTVTIGVSRDGDEARVTVSDTGPGIAAKHLPRIFDRFYRVDEARSRDAGGAGLGLAIAREIAQAHGGRIDVESAPGAGSRFALVVPLAPDAAAG